MKMNKEKITKDDGRYLIYYTFKDREQNNDNKIDKENKIEQDDRGGK
ncbi:MAG: hypothetical protein ACOCRZ_07330 [Halothermotrichaceae bacterium]